MRAQGDLLQVTIEKKKNKSVASGHARTPKKKKGGGSDYDRNVGHALRSIYQKTVDETVPSEMLDLLGKLG